MKYLLILSLIFAVVSCSETTENDTTDIILGPEEGTYDYYVGLSYSGDQTQYNDQNYFYVIIANDTEETINSIDLKVDEETIDLEYANYDGVVFYIAYFYLTIGDSISVQLTINDMESTITIPAISVIDGELPNTIAPDEDVPINWYAENDPQVIYIEGFQNDENHEWLKKSAENLPPNARDFTIPAEWLWSEENVAYRSIQLGIVNYAVVNRIAVAMSDGRYKSYEE